MKSALFLLSALLLSTPAFAGRVGITEGMMDAYVPTPDGAALRMIDAGYPAEWIVYYRGGMQAWRMLGLTVTEQAGIRQGRASLRAPSSDTPDWG